MTVEKTLIAQVNEEMSGYYTVERRIDDMTTETGSEYRNWYINYTAERVGALEALHRLAKAFDNKYVAHCAIEGWGKWFDLHERAKGEYK